MNIKDISLCSNRLDFSLSEEWADFLPAYSWGNLLLTHHLRTTGKVIDLKAKGISFEDVLKCIYKELSFIELGRLYFKINAIADVGDLQLSWRSIFQKYGLNFNENISLLAETINSLPKVFQKWGHEKKLGPKDLAILRCVPQLNRRADQTNTFIAQIAVSISQEQTSKSLGVSILELSLELYLNNTQANTIDKTENETPEEWHKRLSFMRYPQTLAKDKKKLDNLKKLSSPKHIQCQWKRTGDNSGVEIKFVSQSPQDFAQKINSLNSWLPKITQEVWNER